MIRFNRVLLLVIISLCISALDFYGFFLFVKDPLEKVIIPFKSGIYAKENGFLAIVKGISRLGENLSMSSRLDILISQNDELNQKVFLLTAENSKLREQLGSPLPPSYKFIPASVLGVSRFMEIAAGKNDGVRVNMHVISGNNLIGKIISTSTYRSSVQMVNDSGFSVPVKTKRGTRGNLTGSNGTSQVLEKILQKDPLFLEDQVWTSGEGGFPPDLLLGNIKHISSEDVSAYKEAQVEPVIDFNRLDQVFVIRYE